MPSGYPSLFSSPFPSVLPPLLCSLSPLIKLRRNLPLRTTATGSVYAGQRHVPSFTGAGCETTLYALCLTNTRIHTFALMAVPNMHSFWVYTWKILHQLKNSKSKRLAVACPRSNLFLDSYLAGLASVSWCINKTNKVFITLWTTERFPSFFWWRKNNIWGL